MADYISRQAAIRIVCDDECEDCPDGGCDMYRRLKRLTAADVRPVVRGKWEKVGEQMLINLENAREQYAELGYPHRKILNLRCSSCRKVTMVDSSIAYDFCPHCGADMREVKTDD